MSATDTDLVLTETLTEEEWASEGGSGSTEHGMYTKVLVYVRDSGERFHRIPLDRGPFKGKKASSVSTALKQARDSKNAPENVAGIKVKSRGGNEEKGVKPMVFLENTAVDA